MPGAELFVVAMDTQVEKLIESLQWEGLKTIPLRAVEAEFPRLLKAKADRSVGEYCWTLSSFTFAAVFSADKEVEAVTYLDADLYFFSSPLTFLNEFERSKKNVFITEHAYDPQYDQSATSGRFCVQYITFRKTPGGLKVLNWWQERCLEWCYARHEDGKFGDQKYLDVWPEIFGEDVHICQQPEKTLAPWNVKFYEKRGGLAPVFYHFHSFRFVSPSRVRLFCSYRIYGEPIQFYKIYLRELRELIVLLKSKEFTAPILPMQVKPLQGLRDFKSWLLFRQRFATLPQ